MSTVKNGFLFATIVLLTVSSQTDGQTSDLVPPSDTQQRDSLHHREQGLPSVQPFLPLVRQAIDGTTNKTDEPTFRTCQLNAPRPFNSNSKDSPYKVAAYHQPTTGDGSAVSTALMLSVTPEIRIQHECFDCDLCGINTSSCETCASECDARRPTVPESNPVDRSMEQYCEQVATLLQTTLEGSKDNPLAQQRAIQTALKMVVEKSDVNLRVEKEKLEQSHQQSLKQILMEHARKGQPKFAAEDKSLLEPIYATQFRNSRELTKLNDADQSIMRALFSLEKKFASFTMMQRAKLSGTDVQRMMDALKEEQAREQELETLQAELKVLDQRIQQLQARPVVPANHLEPIYMPASPLRPINDPERR